MLVWLNFVVGYGLQAVRNTIPPCIVSKAGSFQATEFHKKTHRKVRETLVGTEYTLNYYKYYISLLSMKTGGNAIPSLG